MAQATPMRPALTFNDRHAPDKTRACEDPSQQTGRPRGRDRPMTPKPTANRPIRAFPTHRKAETAPACTEP